MDDTDEYLARLIRIETRVARIQQHLGIPTRMDNEDLERLELAKEQPTGKRLARIETRVFKLMEAMDLNPRTGKKND
jgi:hypothetical protein